MKRTELTEGQDYLAASSTDWQKYGGARVRVLNATDNLVPYHRFRRITDDDLTEVAAVTTPGGPRTTVKAPVMMAGPRRPHSDVLVADVQPDGSLDRIRLRSTRELRATWERGSQIVADEAARRQAARQARQEHEKALERRLWDLCNRIQAVAGTEVAERVGLQRGNARVGRVMLTLDDLEMILDACGVTDEQKADQ